MTGLVRTVAIHLPGGAHHQTPSDRSAFCLAANFARILDFSVVEKLSHREPGRGSPGGAPCTAVGGLVRSSAPTAPTRDTPRHMPLFTEGWDLQLEL